MQIIRFVNGEMVTPERMKTLSIADPQLEETVRQVRRRVNARPPEKNPPRKDSAR